MRHLFILFTLCVSPVLAETVAIEGAKIYTITNGIIENGTLVMVDGQITAVGDNVTVPDGARIIDARGKHVAPGYMASYTYLGLTESTSDIFPNDHSANESGFTAAFDVKYALNSASPAIAENRRQGVTRAISAPSPSGDIFSGNSAVITLDNSVDMRVREGPMFAQLSGNRNVAFVRLRGIFDQVLDYERNKTRAMRGQSQDYLLSIADMEALIPVVNGDKKLVLEAGNVVEIRGVIALKQDYDIDVVLIGVPEAWKLASELAEADIPVIINVEQNLFPNMTLPGATFSNAERLENAGVKVAIYNGGFSNAYYLAQFAGMAVAHGMSHEGAMRSITQNVAEIFDIDDVYGSLEVGKDADVVVWDGDPLEVTSNTEHVFVRGVEYELVSRRTMLRDRYLDLDDGRPFGLRYKEK
ncbi:MAG: amidohydrolase family protein [Pseudohongiellaceae bacterium]